MAIVIIDGQQLEISDGERLNGIEAAARLGIKIPYYCWHPGLSVVGSCRMCLVEVGGRDAKTGRIAMLPRLAPACNTPMRDGLVLVTQSEKVARARAMVEESLLLRHPIDCPICDKAGECTLQDYYFRYGLPERRADIQPFTSRRRDIGEHVTLFVDRCVLCSRCVRFGREITGSRELLMVGRGADEEIDVLPEAPLANRMSGNVVDLCPVGALCDKDFLYRQRVWFLSPHAGICTACATGCSTWIEENQDRIHRIRPRENAQVNKWWICNDGRYDYPHVHSDRRILRPERRRGDRSTTLDWLSAGREIDAQLRRSGRVAAVFSPFLTVEEAYLLTRYVRAIDPQAALLMGPTPIVGQDERFPGGFSIAAEKCPNRRGVEAVVAHFAGGIVAMDEAWLESKDARKIGAVWVSGGYREPWIDDAAARRLAAGRELLIVQDLFPSAISELANYVLPSGGFAERDGSYVSRNDHLQSMVRAIRPPQGVRTEGGLLWELAGRQGLFDAAAVLREACQEIPYFRAAFRGVSDVGLNLKVFHLADGAGDVAGTDV